MLNWLDRFFGRVRSTIGAGVSDAIHYAVHALAAVVFSVFGLVGKAWSALVGAYKRFLAAVDQFGKEVIAFATYIIKVAIPRVIAWAESELAKLSAAIAAAAADLARWVTEILKRIAAAVTSVIAWVTTNVLDPLLAAVKLLRADLEKWGYTAWYYITHPDKLAALLLDSIVAALEDRAWDIGKRLGGFLLSLIASNLPKLLQLIEDILTAVI